jgi:erythromycin esterase
LDSFFNKLIFKLLGKNKMFKIIIIIISSIIYISCSSQDFEYHNLNSIDNNDTNFTDLLFLKNIFKDVQIVSMGEQSHGDGSTRTAQFRLIKFLHKEMGFNVIATETGMYFSNKLWNTLENKNYNEFDSLSKKENIKKVNFTDLFSLIKQLFLSGNDIYYCGFDINHERYIDLIVDELKEILKQNNKLNSNDSLEYKIEFIKNMVKFNSFESHNLFKSKDSILLFRHFNNIENLLKIINIDNNIKIYLIIKILENIKINIYKNNLSTIDYSNFRDSLMSENIKFLHDRVFNSKMIILAANQHIMDKMQTVKFEGYEKGISMGERLKEYYKDKLYAIGFTAAFGKMYNFYKQEITDLAPPSKNSIEDILVKLNKDFMFIDFRKNNKYFNDEMNGKFLANYETKSKWGANFDGMIFIKNQHE